MLSEFSYKMQRIITRKLGFSEFRPVQKKAIPLILEGENVLIIAPTATGKTEAFLLPILNRIYNEKLEATSMLYISPIKALINNQYVRFRNIGKYLGISTFKWHGDVESHKRKSYLDSQTDILMITPESLEVILFSDNYQHGEIFSNLKFVVIDEIHAFAGDERGVHLLSLLERIKKFSGHLQRIGVSATIGNPTGMAEWLKGSNPGEVIPVIDKGNRGKQVKVMYYREINNKLRSHLLAEARESKSLFFSNSRARTELMNRLVTDYPVETYVHHSSIDKHIREKAEERFRITTRNNMIIFCTSTLELGIDIGGLDKVFQLNPPYRVSDFLQRIGRSGRKTNLANTVIYNTSREDLLRCIGIINLIIAEFVEPIKFRGKAWDILFHQILTLVHQEFRISADKVYNTLSNVYSFKNISSDEFDFLINYMLEKGYLIRHKNYLMVGEETQKEFGYANFYDFYSVFENINQYTVIHNHRAIGTLDSFYVNTLDASDISFYLPEEIWSIQSVDEDHLRVYVEPAKKGKVPYWMSGSSMIDRWLAEEIYNVICDDEKYYFLNEKEIQILEKVRKKYRKQGFAHGKVIIENGDRLIIHSYAGDKINLTLGLFLKNELGAVKFMYAYDEIKLSFSGDEEDKARLVKASLEAIKDRKLILSTRMLRNMIDELPIKRVSKYYEYLPNLLQKELIEDMLFDVKGCLEFLQEKEFEIK